MSDLHRCDSCFEGCIRDGRCDFCGEAEEVSGVRGGQGRSAASVCRDGTATIAFLRAVLIALAVGGVVFVIARAVGL